MKRNLLSIVILTLGVINMILAAVIVFTVVPTTTRTNNLIAKVASNIDLELESPALNSKEEVISITDVETFPLPDELTMNLKKTVNDSTRHFALLSVSLSINTKSKDYKSLNPEVVNNVSAINEIIRGEFLKYTIDNVLDSQETIKAEILIKIQEHFGSDFIFNITFGKLIVE